MNMKIDDWCINERKKRIVKIYEGKGRRERERVADNDTNAILRGRLTMTIGRSEIAGRKYLTSI